MFGGNLTIENWISKILEMDTTKQGIAYVSVWLLGSRRIHIKTSNNKISDIFDETLIPINLNLFNQVEEVSGGDKILISGNFISSEEDFIR